MFDIQLFVINDNSLQNYKNKLIFERIIMSILTK